MQAVLRAYVTEFGAQRLHWGSNFPMSQPSMTYRQTLECVRECAPWLTDNQLDLILGESLVALLGGAV
jgi:predicted TIM-barrel fold metal-dependent hydrolase